MSDNIFETLVHTFREQLGHAKFDAAMADAKQRDIAMLEAFVSAVCADDFVACGAALYEMQGRELWPVVAFAASECKPTDSFRRRFLALWMEQGDLLRNEFADDVALLAFLRAMLPCYVGPPRRLFRSEFAFNVVTREFGMSWTSRIEVARRFSTGVRCTSPGGLAIIETRAPPEAIIARGRKTDRLRQQEFEYVVDGRRVGQVKVVQRFPAVWPADCSDIPEEVRKRWRDSSPDLRARWEAAAVDLPLGFTV
jgi:hypothetical protein